MQTYNVRVCLTNAPENRIPITPPDNYDSTRYDLYLRMIKNKQPKDLPFVLSQMPNHKTDINNNGPFSTDLIGYSYDYPDGDEWFTIEYLIPFNIKLPDNLKGPDYFTTISISEGKHFWRHRELIRFKYGKSKKLLESLEFIDKKYRELSKSLNDSSVINQL